MWLSPSKRIRIGFIAAGCCLFAVLGLTQVRPRVWAQYEAEMQDPVDDPTDVGRKGDFRLGRLRYRSDLDGRRGRYSRWGIDANKCDRLLIAVLNRLTRIDAEPIETIIDIDSDEMFNYPWLLAISVTTLIAQVAMFRSLGGDAGQIGQALAIALVGTLYGCMLQNLVAGPIAEKLSVKSHEEAFAKEIVLQGILSIQAGNNPRVVEMQLLSFLSAKQQAGLAKAA